MKRVFIAFFALIVSALSFGQRNTIRDPTGIYQYAGRAIVENGEAYGYAGRIKVLLIEPEKIIVNLYVNKGAPSYNSGQIIDTLLYQNDMAVWLDSTMSTCKLVFHFSRRKLFVEMFADDPNFACGFGHAVNAQGNYLKMKQKKPTMEEMFSEYD
jgi:hypothetical protein